MNHLLRGLAPLSEPAWREIEAEARRTLTHFLTARRLVDVVGPLGWEHDAVARGRFVELPRPTEAFARDCRAPQPLVELRVDFEIPRAALDALDRGAPDVDLQSVRDAGRRLALAEDTMVLGDGTFADAGGLGAASPHAPILIGDDAARRAARRARARSRSSRTPESAGPMPSRSVRTPTPKSSRPRRWAAIPCSSTSD